MSDSYIESTPLWEDVKSITTSVGAITKWSYRAMFHTEKEDIPLGQILSWDEMRDYAGNIGGHHIVSFMLGLGDYIYRFYPYRTYMELSIKAIPLTDDGNDRADLKEIVRRYKVLFRTQDNLTPAQDAQSQQDAQTLNTAQMVTVKVELQDRALEPLRLKMVQGVFRQVSYERFLKSVFVGESQDLQIDGKNAVDGVELYPVDNRDVQNEIVVPQGTLLPNLSTWCQEKGTGIYNAGIGTFFQNFDGKNLWFIFPLFNFKRFDQGKKRCIFHAVPPGRMNGADRTYKVEGDVTKILVTSDTNMVTDDISEQNEGSGFRMPSAMAGSKKPVVIDKGVAKYNRAQSMTEVVAKERPDGLNFAPYVKSSGNVFHEYSKVLSRGCTKLELVWENANPELIYPGMPCQYVFMDHGKYVELKGCVAGIFIQRSLQGKSATAKTYLTHATMALILEPYQPDLKLPEVIPAGEF